MKKKENRIEMLFFQHGISMDYDFTSAVVAHNRPIQSWACQHVTMDQEALLLPAELLATDGFWDKVDPSLRSLPGSNG